MDRERGFILPMVIFSLAIMGVLVLVIVSTSDDDRLGSRYDLEGTRSFNAAEAGLADILSDWKADNLEGTVLNVGNSNVLSWATLPNNAGRYRATILKADSATFVITVDGQSAGARRGLRTVQMMLVPGVFFKYAVLGGSDVKFSGGSSTDSYDSDSGAYNVAGNIGTGGDIASNGTISQLCTTANCIHGDATAKTTISGGCPNTKIDEICTQNTGTTTPMPPISCPNPPASPYPDLSISGTVVTLPVPPTAYYYRNITVSGGAGRLNFSFGSPPEHVDVWVSGSVTVSGGAQINNASQDPTRLTFYGCGTAAVGTWTLSGGSGAYFAVYAPKHPITISGSSGLFGALVGASLTNSGGAAIHYDAALGRVPSLVLVPGSWTEITR
jgi:hypothetical protein